MRKCNCNSDVNLTAAEIKINSPHDISIVIDRESSDPTIKQLRERIEQLEELGLNIGEQVDEKIAEAISAMDIVTRTALSELLANYSTVSQLDALTDSVMTLLAAEREYNESKFLQKAYVTQAQYDAMGEDDKKPNTIYVIRD